MRVIVEVTNDVDDVISVQSWHTIAEARIAIKDAAGCYGSLEASIWRWPGDEYRSVDVPTWRMIRTTRQFVRTERFITR